MADGLSRRGAGVRHEPEGAGVTGVGGDASGHGREVPGRRLVRRLTADLDADLATGAPLPHIVANRALYDRSELQARGLVPL